MAFQRSAFQFGAFQMADVPLPTVLTRGPSGSAFSRKRFDELMAAWRAQEELEHRAEEAKGKRKKALAEAAKVTADALNAVEQLADLAQAAVQEAELVTLTNTINGALSATTMAGTINLANAVAEYAMQMQAEIDDEEEAITLLLLDE